MTKMYVMFPHGSALVRVGETTTRLNCCGACAESYEMDWRGRMRCGRCWSYPTGKWNVSELKSDCYALNIKKGTPNDFTL